LKITKGLVATIEYSLKDEMGNVIDSSESNGPLSYMHGYKNIVLGLEEALEGKTVDDTFTVSVAPEKAYGVRDEEMVFTVPSENFRNEEEELVVGMEFDTAINGTPYVLTVVEILKDQIKVDANHPLAGKPLFFDVKVLSIRASYTEEKVLGHPMEKD
jgi:FKBP-type peptidyl-prolyl cis-trans isomerase SlyD